MADPDEVARALRGGPETLGWALDELVARGWVDSSAGADCGPDGVCSTTAPAVYTLTAAGRAAAP